MTGETPPLSPLDTTGFPVYARIIWFLGLPTVFAVWLLYYVLHVQPLQTEAITNLAKVVTEHERLETQRMNELIRALNYDEAILRAICLALMPYKNKEEALKCQPLFTKEYDFYAPK